MGGALRIVVLLGIAAGVVVVAAACGDEEGASGETLPPIRTTTTTTASTAPPTTRPRTYEIQEGESLTAVAERFGIDYLELAKYNGLDNPDDIQAGQVINIPPVRVRQTTTTARS